MERRTFLKNSVGIAASAGLNLPLVESNSSKDPVPYNLYWGDLHCHSGISYGRGSLKNAFIAAQENRLDFCSVVGHSSWHDTPRDAEHMNRIKDYIVYHDEGYKHLAELWPDVKELTRKVRKPGKFIPFLAFEWHSIKYGDHNVYYLEPEGEIIKANSIEELRRKMSGQKAIIIPHHIGYAPGSRGINWDHYVSSEQSPFVEVYSFHGCSVTDTSPYPMLREMGARSYERTMEAGLKKGHKFGIIGSTDNHYGYPGSYGEGKLAVYADKLTHLSLWDAFKARRVYAVTGDRIIVDFSVDNAFMGEETAGRNRREINFRISGEDFIDYLDLIKNGSIIKRFNPPFSYPKPNPSAVRAKIRFQWGWGVRNRLTEWTGKCQLTDGRILAITPCFRAQHSEGGAISGERGEIQEQNSLVSKILEQDGASAAFSSYSYGNPTPLTPINNSIVLDVEMPLSASIKMDINNRKFEHTLAELLEGQRSHLIGGYLDVMVSFFRAVPYEAFTLQGRYIDSETENSTDHYYLAVRQRNNQWAWSSPIWVRR